MAISGLSGRLVEATRVQLKGSSEFSEAWLEDVVANKPNLLGLPEAVRVVQRQVSQPSGGKLDLLLESDETDTRYTVELMLGATDPSHIVRCIEYWDVERKRHRDYAHIAVLVAESVTSRFQNVIGLFNSVIPIIAIQVNALRVRDELVLDFVTVMNLADTGSTADDGESASKAATEADWDTPERHKALQWAKRCLDVIREFEPKANLTYVQSYVGISIEGRVNNFVTFRPRANVLRIHGHGADPAIWREKLASEGLTLPTTRQGFIKVDLREGDIDKHRVVLKELFDECYRTH